MTTIDEMISVMQAYMEGAEIEYWFEDAGDNWLPASTPSWDWRKNTYRIKKPEPKKVKMWQWVFQSLGSNPSLTSGFFKDEQGVAANLGKMCKIIQRADWTEIEVTE